MMNYKEIVSKLEGLGVTPENLHHGEFTVENEGGEDKEIDVEDLLKENFGNVKDVSVDEAYDGKQVQCVYHFVDHDVYVGYTYGYSSWGDSDYDTGFMECRPQTESVIRYVEVSNG